MKYEVEGEQQTIKIVKPSGSGAVVYVPKSWRGREVIVILKNK